MTEAQQLPDFDLDLKAYTDDVGSAKYNEQLAQRRAKSLEDYLAENKLVATKTEMQSIGEIALISDSDIKTERKNNRRVDIILTPFAPQSLNDFFSYISNRKLQQFMINNEHDITITGKKGTEIKIPANSFVDANGKLVTSVTITLKEAYSYEDMLSHNLGTISGDKLLESGGMIYIEAQNMKGEKLTLGQNSSIEIGMPSSKPLPDDMQLFLASRNNVGDDMSWNATGTAFNVQKRITTRKPTGRLTNPRQYDLKAIAPGGLEEFKLPKLPSLVKKPLQPGIPKEAFQSKNPFPDAEWVRKKYKRKKMESHRKYEDRLTEIRKSCMKVFRNAEAGNAKRYAKYQKDSLAYEAEMLVYNAAMDDYYDYLELFKPIAVKLYNLRNFINSRIQNYTVLESSTVLSQYHQLTTFLDVSDDYKTYITEHCTGLGLNETLANINALDLGPIDSLRQNLKYWLACATALENRKKSFGHRKNTK